MSETARIIDVTPEMALRLLEHNEKNRNKSDPRIKSLANDMSNRRFFVTNQGIGIGGGGELYDGQHRLEAVVLSGMTVRMLVVTGLQPETRTVIDVMKSRSVSDVLRMFDGVENSRLLTSRLNAIECIRENHNKSVLTANQTRDRQEQYREGLQWSFEEFPGGQGFGQAAVSSIDIAQRHPEQDHRLHYRGPDPGVQKSYVRVQRAYRSEATPHHS